MIIDYDTINKQRMIEAWKVESNPRRKVAYQIALGLLPIDLAYCIPWMARYVASVLAKMGSDVNHRDLMLLAAWDAAQAEDGQEPTFARVKRALKRLYPKHNVSRVADYSLRRSFRRLQLPLRQDKRGRRANEK